MGSWLLAKGFLATVTMILYQPAIYVGKKHYKSFTKIMLHVKGLKRGHDI